jgi:hypothetical protein
LFDNDLSSTTVPAPQQRGENKGKTRNPVSFTVNITQLPKKKTKSAKLFTVLCE